MRYQGGKGKLAKVLAPMILEHAAGRRIVEPFYGGLAMTHALQPAMASDLSKPMFTLVQAVRGGWEPPVFMSAEEYSVLARRKDDHDDPLVCFAGQGCTFGGKWFGGYARGHVRQREPIQAAGRTLLKRVRGTLSTDFRLGSYSDTAVVAGDVVYCDPPYRDTCQTYPTPPFDSDAFWNWCRSAADRGADVFVSEFTAPDDVVIFWEKERPTQTRHNDRSTVIERLFHIPAAD